MPKQQMIFAARAAGIMPLGFIDSVASFGDWDAFAQMVRRSRQFGFMGAGCIHPGQVPIVNEQYSPSPTRSRTRTRIVEEDAVHAAAGRGSWSLDGKMIDVPVVVRARAAPRAPRGDRGERSVRQSPGVALQAARPDIADEHHFHRLTRRSASKPASASPSASRCVIRSAGRPGRLRYQARSHPRSDGARWRRRQSTSGSSASPAARRSRSRVRCRDSTSVPDRRRCRARSEWPPMCRRPRSTDRYPRPPVTPAHAPHLRSVAQERLRAERGGECEPRFVTGLAVHHDGPDARGLKDLEVQEAERAGSDDCGRGCQAIGLTRSSVCTAVASGSRNAALSSVTSIWQRQQRRRGDDDELREDAGAREPDVVPVLAEVVVAAKTVEAVAAAGDGLDADARARRWPARPWAERDDLACRLVPDDQRRRNGLPPPAITPS